MTNNKERRKIYKKNIKISPTYNYLNNFVGNEHARYMHSRASPP